MTAEVSDGTLRFAAGSLVVITGLPGAGKSTLLARLYGLTGEEIAPVAVGAVRVIDSGQSRNRWARSLAWVAKPVRTLVVYLTHVSRIARMLADGHSVVAHNRGAWAHVLYGFAWLARRYGREFHLVLLDVEPETALAGQRVRGRVVAPGTFARHCRRWRRLIGQVRSGKPGPATSVTVLDREAADAVRGIVFVEWKVVAAGSPGRGGRSRP
ncbi:AAA family ATPase [Thermopolyspora sp. NPDC052614]|uniref:AAA family ATPase n=1 Tax=Thermopolyspora sp. NPDC052614 TaxID=3155682 RepID=UPI003412B852